MKRGPYRKKPVYQRFMAKVVVDPSGCMLWVGARNDRGYGQIRIEGALVYAHRWAFEYAFGPIPAGLQLDHLCRVRHCVNAAHLEPVTNSENQARGERAQLTYCVNGHEFTPENTYRRPDTGGRQCRKCALDRYHARNQLTS